MRLRVRAFSLRVLTSSMVTAVAVTAVTAVTAVMAFTTATAATAAAQSVTAQPDVNTLQAQTPTSFQGVNLFHKDITVESLIQFWGFNDTTAIAGTAQSNFRVRRGEIRLGGTVVENTQWYIMADLAKTLKTGPVSQANDNKVLQDAVLSFAPAKNFEITLGQFKIPTTVESMDRSYDLLFWERGLITRTWGDRREPGAMISYKPDAFSVSAMLSNGQGTNVDDVDNEKDLHVRADYKWDRFTVGAFTSVGDYSYGKKGRWGANVKATFDKWLLRAEGVEATDNGAESNGWYADAAYSINAKWQAALRFESMKVAGVIASSPTAALNYYLSKNAAKFQLSYTVLNNETTVDGAPAFAAGTNGALVMANSQMFF